MFAMVCLAEDVFLFSERIDLISSLPQPARCSKTFRKSLNRGAELLSS